MLDSVEQSLGEFMNGVSIVPSAEFKNRIKVSYKYKSLLLIC